MHCPINVPTVIFICPHYARGGSMLYFEVCIPVCSTVRYNTIVRILVHITRTCGRKWRRVLGNGRHNGAFKQGKRAPERVLKGKRWVRFMIDTRGGETCIRYAYELYVLYVHHQLSQMASEAITQRRSAPNCCSHKILRRRAVPRCART